MLKKYIHRDCIFSKLKNKPIHRLSPWKLQKVIVMGTRTSHRDLYVQSIELEVDDKGKAEYTKNTAPWSDADITNFFNLKQKLHFN